MKLCNKLLFVTALSMTVLHGVSAQPVQAAQPWSGEQPLFSDFHDPSGGGVSRSQVQNEAQQAMGNNTFSDGKAHLRGLERSTNSQNSSVSRDAVRTQAEEAMRTNQIRVGDGY